LDKRLEAVEEKLSQLPVPFKIMYKPAYREKHVDLVEYLDQINKRLEQIENGSVCCDI
jgi:P2-related tail formation protein